MFELHIRTYQLEAVCNPYWVLQVQTCVWHLTCGYAVVNEPPSLSFLCCIGASFEVIYCTLTFFNIGMQWQIHSCVWGHHVIVTYCWGRTTNIGVASWLTHMLGCQNCHSCMNSQGHRQVCKSGRAGMLLSAYMQIFGYSPLKIQGTAILLDKTNLKPGGASALLAPLLFTPLTLIIIILVPVLRVLYYMLHSFVHLLDFL